MKVRCLHIIFLLLFVAILSCNERVTQEELIESAIQLKMEQWRREQIKLCSEKAIAAAEAYVDSILVIYSLPSKLDTIPKPPKPSKPLKPVFKVKPDRVVVDTL